MAQRAEKLCRLSVMYYNVSILGPPRLLGTPLAPAAFAGLGVEPAPVLRYPPAQGYTDRAIADFSKAIELAPEVRGVERVQLELGCRLSRAEKIAACTCHPASHAARAGALQAMQGNPLTTSFAARAGRAGRRALPEPGGGQGAAGCGAAGVWGAGAGCGAVAVCDGRLRCGSGAGPPGVRRCGLGG